MAAPDYPIPDGYAVLSLLGEGGMGAVFKARHTQLEWLVAIKYLKSQDPALIDRFKREAQILSRLKHPNVVALHGFGGIGTMPYMIFEFVEGEDLARAIARTGAIPLPRALEIVRGILDGLGHAHQQGIVHRDLKPENILLGRDGVIKVADFGVAGLQDGSGGGLTQAGTVMGTPAYMSPEQAAGSPADHRADLYAVGAILFRMLTGHLPIEEEHPLRLLSLKQTQEATRLRTLVPAASLRLEQILSRCLERDPERRFQSGAELRKALDTVPVTRTGVVKSLGSGAVSRPGRSPGPAAGPSGARPATRGIPGPGATIASGTAPPAIRRWFRVATACGLITAILIGFVLSKGQPRSTPSPMVAPTPVAPGSAGPATVILPLPPWHAAPAGPGDRIALFRAMHRHLFLEMAPLSEEIREARKHRAPVTRKLVMKVLALASKTWSPAQLSDLTSGNRERAGKLLERLTRSVDILRSWYAAALAAAGPLLDDPELGLDEKRVIYEVLLPARLVDSLIERYQMPIDSLRSDQALGHTFGIALPWASTAAGAFDKQCLDVDPARKLDSRLYLYAPDAVEGQEAMQDVAFATPHKRTDVATVRFRDDAVRGLPESRASAAALTVSVEPSNQAKDKFIAGDLFLVLAGTFPLLLHRGCIRGFAPADKTVQLSHGIDPRFIEKGALPYHIVFETLTRDQCVFPIRVRAVGVRGTR